MQKHIYTTLLFLLSMAADAQPGALDVSFNFGGSGANNTVNRVALQPDGKLVIGGAFTSFNGKTQNRLSRLTPDGAIDTTFKIGAGLTKSWQAVGAIAIQTDGKILVGGAFDTLSGYPVNNIVRLHPDGAIDTSFKIRTGFNNGVSAIAIQPDDKILVGGLFTQYNGLTANRVIRLLPDGAIDSTWDRTYGADGSVGVIKVQPDGKVMLGGDFVTYGGVGNTYLSFRITRANADGTRDLGFQAIPGASRAVSTIVIQPDGDYLVGGNFIQYDMQSIKRLTRLKPNGPRDPFFSTGDGTDNGVGDIERFANGDVMVVGGFSSYNNTPAKCLFKIKSSGLIDTGFVYGSGANDGIADAQIDSNQRVIIAGAFTEYNGTASNRIARLYNCRTTQPVSISGDSIVNCPNTTLTYSIAPVQGADKYEWTLPNGWTGSSDSTSITAISNGKPGTVSVKAFSNACGYSYSSTLAVTQILPPSPSICLVTVDSASTHNIVIWEKQPTNLIDSFCIYRQTATNVYTKIASVPYDSLSEYHDYAANPNVTSYSYKLSTVDTCGVESALSLYHSTIHLQNLANGNFQWTFYQIEGQLNPILSFNFYRDANNNNNYFPIGNIPGTNSTYTDLTYSSFPDANYVVDANWSIACTPSRAAINTTRSNIKKDKTGIDLLSVNDVEKAVLLVYPNPTNGWLNIATKGGQLTSVALVNALGQTVWFERENKSAFQINTQSLPKGVYAVIAETNKGKATTRVVLN